MNSYAIEVNNRILEWRDSLDECWDICYDLAQEFGHAEVVAYSLNGTRVLYGEYTDRD
tara:strand:+ start:764 stop:937 length:174 start_codon:yes stop_codon:yes gene_type:complete